MLALITERAAFRPLRNADPTTLLISSFAVSFFLQKLLILVVGSRLKGLDFLPALGRQIEFAGVRLQLLQIVDHPRQRRAPRRADLVPAGDAARPADARRRRGFPHGAGAGRAGQPRDRRRLCAERHPRRRCLLPDRRADRRGAAADGLQLVIIAFVGTVIGGLGSLSGAALGGFLVGAASILLQAFLPPDLRAFREAFVFVAVALVLLFRPQGLIPARGLKERI